MLMNKIKLGLVGCGSWAQETHLPYLIRQPRVELAAIVDITAEQRKSELTTKYAPGLVTTDVGRLLSDHAIDAVVISTPHVSHFEIAAQAVKRGVHVHVDKPICSNVNQIDSLLNYAQETGALVSTHTQRKYMPGQSQLRWYLRSHFSELYHVFGSMWQPQFEDFAGSWRADRTLAGGGILMDSGYHLVDTILSLFESTTTTDIQNISAVAHNGNGTSDAFATLVFKVCKTVVQVNAFRGTPKALKKEEYQVLGDGGHIGLSYTAGTRHKSCSLLYLSNDGRAQESQNVPVTSAFRFHPLQLFIEAVSGNCESRELIRHNVLIARSTLFTLESAYGQLGI